MAPAERVDRLVVDDLVVAYGGSHVVTGVSLRAAAGEAVALLGRNGAGKTSTLMAIAGALRPAGGEVRVDGRPVQGLPAFRIARHGVSTVPQGRRIFAPLTVRENLTVAARNGALEHVERLFPVLRDRARQRGSSLSGGEQQMLAIARALLTRPRLLLMDEPSEGLAPRVVRTIADLIRRLREEEDLTILITEQNLLLALAVADRVYVLERGAIVHEAPAADFRHDRERQRQFLGV